MPPSFQLAQSGKVLGHDLVFGTRGEALGGHALESGSAHTEWLFMWITWISVIAFVVVVGLTVFFAWKYRRRPGVKTIRSPGHNTVLELGWSIIPLVIMAWMFFEGFHGYINRTITEAGAEEIQLTAKKWSWSFTYPNGAASTQQWKAPVGGNTDVNYVFVVPEDHPVLLRMISDDVIHSFWVPDFRTKMDVFPNRFTSYAFKAKPLTEADPTHEGDPEAKSPYDKLTYRYRDHFVFCAEYCGDLHSEMSAVLRVVPMDIYKQIVKSWAGPPEGMPWEKGAYYAKRLGCVTCHSADGTPGQGPSWKDTWGRQVQFVDGGSRIADESYIRQSILQPGSEVVAGYQPMPSQVVPTEYIADLTAYIRYLTEGVPSLGGEALEDASPENQAGDENPDTQTPQGQDGSRQDGHS